ncbi:hypothetical protein HY411_00310 [Candidatus Gottesmanbacteria bacterium]|nr:hypothetical protein [Candidatus Gottesmanbacteria bacterium]
MNWITTNIRFPEDLYMTLKAEAARRRVSLAAVIRQRLTDKKKRSPAEVARMMRSVRKLADQNARESGVGSLSDALIQMRYEQ